MALLLILAIAIASQVVAETVGPVLARGSLSGGNAILLGIGATALLALVIVNVRWLWVTMGHLRFALALITIWGVSSVLGTLVVQRFPNQTDTGYAKNFTSATGDFLYHMTNLGTSVVVHPEPDVVAWLAEQEQLFGERQGKEIRKQWFAAETGRLKAMRIETWIEDNRELLAGILSTVNALRLPEAFQISVWFKSILGLIATSLVIVVVQRWRGEWRQVGWVMAHFGMVIFIVGASVRATTKVDGFLPMEVGQSADYYFRNITKGREVTPLDFQFTLHRFKTEYPKQLAVSFAGSEVSPQGAGKTYRPTEGWEHGFLGGELNVRVDRLLENAEAVEVHLERPDGEPNPALLVDVDVRWLAKGELALLGGRSLFAPPDNGYHLQYVRAEDEAERDELSAPSLSSVVGNLWVTDGRELGPVRSGGTWSLPGPAEIELRLVSVWPDATLRDDPGGPQAFPWDPALQFDVYSRGTRLGEAFAMTDRMEMSEGLFLPQLRFEPDSWALPAPLHYRIVESPDGDLRLLTYRNGSREDMHELAPNEELVVGAEGDRLKILKSFARHMRETRVQAADTSGMTPEDVYYATLPTALELTLTGPAVARVAGNLANSLAERTPPPGSGIVTPAAFDAGEGSLTAGAGGASLRVRLLSDDAGLDSFPAPLLRSAGLGFPFALSLFTNTRGAPLRFTSDVTLSKDGKVLKRALVEPNKPLYLGGYQFSQADFRAEDPSYSGFGVVRDPSVRIVYIGMGILTLGVILLFYINPVVAGRRRPEKAA